MDVSLTELQREIMTEFYQKGATKVIYNKKARNKIWKLASKKTCFDLTDISRRCPALLHRITRSYASGDNIQSAVFSECVYAQTLANMFGLDVFINCDEYQYSLPEQAYSLLKSNSLTPRYIYADRCYSTLLVQAGGFAGVDCALILPKYSKIYTIEFKERGAKTSEVDLPKYNEDGRLVITDTFVDKHPQFETMLREQTVLNFFEVMGSNVHNFSKASVSEAVLNNYNEKHADVVCTEDTDGCLVMLPANQITRWAQTGGEIRPAGRNPYYVWTPNALTDMLIKKGAVIKDGKVRINENLLSVRRARGGNGMITGYKINPLFFVRVEACEQIGEDIVFNLADTYQLNPTVAGKMFFENLKHSEVKKYYF